MRLIGNSVAAEELLRRTRAQVAADIGDYSVFEIDGNMVGCVAIHPLEFFTEVNANFRSNLSSNAWFASLLREE